MFIILECFRQFINLVFQLICLYRICSSGFCQRIVLLLQIFQFVGHFLGRCCQRCLRLFSIIFCVCHINNGSRHSRYRRNYKHNRTEGYRHGGSQGCARHCCNLRDSDIGGYSKRNGSHTDNNPCQHCGNSRMLIDQFRKSVCNIRNPILKLAYYRIQVIPDSNRQIIETVLHPLRAESSGIRHCLVCCLGSPGRIRQLLQVGIKGIQPLVDNSICRFSSLGAAPQVHHRLSIPAGALVHNIQHVSQSISCVHQLSEGHSRFLRDDCGHIGSGAAQLIEHAGNIGRGLLNADAGFRQADVS